MATIRDLRILECFRETTDPNAIQRRLSDLEDALDDITHLCTKAANVTALRQQWPDYRRVLGKIHALTVDVQPVRKQ